MPLVGCSGLLGGRTHFIWPLFPARAKRRTTRALPVAKSATNASMNQYAPFGSTYTYSSVGRYQRTAPAVIAVVATNTPTPTLTAILTILFIP